MLIVTYVAIVVHFLPKMMPMFLCFKWKINEGIYKVPL